MLLNSPVSTAVGYDSLKCMAVGTGVFEAIGDENTL